MSEHQTCPKCGEECDRESCDVEVGVIHGPWGCPCGYSEDPRYDMSEGENAATEEFKSKGRVVNQYGMSHSIERIGEDLARFGLKHMLDDVTKPRKR